MRSRRISDQLAFLAVRLERVEDMLLLKDPGAARAAEAYDGLRRQVVAAAAERVAHLAHLVQVDAAVRAGEPPESLALLTADLLAQVGVERRDDPGVPDAYDLDGPAGSGPDELRVVEPAYVESHTGRVVRRGRAIRIRRQAS